VTSGQQESTFDQLSVDHIRFYVRDVAAKAAGFGQRYGLDLVKGRSTDADDATSIALISNGIRLVFTEPLIRDHPGAAYLEQHGDGVADIALRTGDAAAAFAEAVRRGAQPISGPAENSGRVTASIAGFGDVVHTFVEYRDGAATLPPGFEAGAEVTAQATAGLREVDHFAVCLEAGQLDPTVDFYVEVLDFATIFEERIVVGSQAMLSKVVQSRSGAVTLTLIEPDVSCDPGQIDQFIKNHGGAGVQHVALTTDDIVRSVGTLVERDVEFLVTPGTYYELLAQRLELSRHEVGELRALNLLVDEDHDGQLYQIFARSTHPKNTFFMEIIERAGARTFGSGNIKALYEAVELQRSKQEPQ
jgi:4-hydroxymandelate synthase